MQPHGDVDALFQFKLGTYLYVSSVALFVYDYLLMFDHEVAYVWRKHFSIPSALFYLNRYPAFIDLSLSLYNEVAGASHEDQCKTMNIAVGLMFFFGIIVSEFIMLLRVWVFWGRTKKITIFLCASSAMVFIPGATIYVVSHHNFSSLKIHSLPTDILGCHSTSTLVSVDYALIMLYDTSILILTIIRCLRGSYSLISLLKCPSPLIALFIHEGVIYFICIFTVSFTNLMLVLTASEVRYPMYSFQRCLHSIFVGRVFLHLRHGSSSTQEISEPTHMLDFAHTGRSSEHEADARSTNISVPMA